MGPEWSTSTVLRDQTIPAILIKPGVTIRPVRLSSSWLRSLGLMYVAARSRTRSRGRRGVAQATRRWSSFCNDSCTQNVLCSPFARFRCRSPCASSLLCETIAAKLRLLVPPPFSLHPSTRSFCPQSCASLLAPPVSRLPRRANSSPGEASPPRASPSPSHSPFLSSVSSRRRAPPFSSLMALPTHGYYCFEVINARLTRGDRKSVV